jgi:hypothetical protein
MFEGAMWCYFCRLQPFLPSASCLSFSVFLCVTGRASSGRAGVGWARSQIILRRESLVLHKSFNTLWYRVTSFWLGSSVFLITVHYTAHAKTCGPFVIEAFLVSLQYIHHIFHPIRAPDWLLVTVPTKLLVSWNTCALLDVLLPQNWWEPVASWLST